MKNLSYILVLATLLVSCSDFGEEALADVKNGDKWGYINPKGKFVINPQFDGAWSFSEGLALMNIGGKPDRHKIVGGKYGYINPKGEIVINPQFVHAGPFSK